MKTLKLEEFLKLPVGTIFYSFDLSNICVKEDSIYGLLKND